jgi:hypothetical protein
MPKGDAGVDMATHNLIQKLRMTQTAMSTWTEQVLGTERLRRLCCTLNISPLELVEPYLMVWTMDC